MKLKYRIRNIKYTICKPFKQVYNYFLLKKYPWLTPYNVWSGKLSDDYKYEYTWYDDIPNGWAKGFGKLLIKDIDKAIGGNSEKILFQQIKEKYGDLRIYATTTDEAHKVINTYECISGNTCICCGKPEAYMLGLGWISPYCEKCFNKLKKRNKYFASKEYMDYVDEDDTGHLPMQYKYTRFSKDGDDTVIVDISDTSKKIIKHWNRRHPFRKAREFYENI